MRGGSRPRGYGIVALSHRKIVEFLQPAGIIYGVARLARAHVVRSLIHGRRLHAIAAAAAEFAAKVREFAELALHFDIRHEHGGQRLVAVCQGVIEKNAGNFR